MDSKYPDGALWLCNKVYGVGFLSKLGISNGVEQTKILRLTGRPEEAITALKDGLAKGGTFLQADALVCLVWISCTLH